MARKYGWKEWHELAEAQGLDLIDNPAVVRLARCLRAHREFMEWVGFTEPTLMNPMAAAHIVVSALMRMQVRYGRWDVHQKRIPHPLNRLDELTGVPGLGKSMWESGFIASSDHETTTIAVPYELRQAINESGREAIDRNIAERKAAGDVLATLAEVEAQLSLGE